MVSGPQAVLVLSHTGSAAAPQRQPPVRVPQCDVRREAHVPEQRKWGQIYFSEGAEPYAVKAARTVLNGGNEETCMVQRALSLSHCLDPAFGRA